MDRFASCCNKDLGTFASCLKCIPGGSLGFPTNPAIRSVSLSCCNPTDLPTELSDPWSAPGRGRGLHLVAGRYAAHENKCARHGVHPWVLAGPCGRQHAQHTSGSSQTCPNLIVPAACKTMDRFASCCNHEIWARLRTA
eukprot:gene24676-biopygen14962